MRAQREHWRAPASEEKRGEEGKGGMERTGAEKGAKRKKKEEGEGGAAGAKEEVRDTAVGSPAAGEDERGRRKRRSGEGRERREEGEKIYKLPIKKKMMLTGVKYMQKRRREVREYGGECKRATVRDFCIHQCMESLGFLKRGHHKSRREANSPIRRSQSIV